MPFLLSDSLMCMDPLHMGDQLGVLESVVDWHHADVMDGHFCPNLTLSPDTVRAVCRASRVPVEAHLMTERPGDWIDVFANAGARMISLHAETISASAFRLIRHIRELGCQVGVVLNPSTSLEAARYYLEEIDRLTLMAVDVGYAGQPMVPQVIGKIREAAEARAARGLRYEIQVDGCCNRASYRLYRDAGADALVMGSGLFGLDADLHKAVELMREQQREALA